MYRQVPTRPTAPAGLTVWDKELACAGYTLYCHLRGEPRVYLVNMRGEEVRTWDVGIPPHYAEMLPNGNLLVLGNVPDSGAGVIDQAFMLRELTWDGAQVWEYRKLNVHHDFARLPNGNTLVVGQESIPPDIVSKVRGGQPGTERDGKMLGDLFAEITPDGGVAWEWHSHEYLDPDDDVICPLCARAEWTHANSCEPLPNGDVLTTFRLTNTVAIVDRRTGGFRWKWGRGELGHPHDPTLLANGNVLLFDNGMHIPRLPRSRVLEVNPVTNEIAWSYQSERYLDFFSPHISGAQRLWNGNTLICEGDRGRIFEVTTQGDVVWEFYNPHYSEDNMSVRRRQAWVPNVDRGWGRTVHNWVFRAPRYPPDFQAFNRKKLPPVE